MGQLDIYFLFGPSVPFSSVISFPHCSVFSILFALELFIIFRHFFSIYSSDYNIPVRLFCCCPSVTQSWLFAVSRTAPCQASLSFTISWSLLKLTFTESVMPWNHLILGRPLLLLPSVFPSIRIFRIKWPKYQSFSFCPCNEHSGLISFKINC